MKIAVLLGDGMAGEPLAELGGKTTLMAARTPEMDRLASMGNLGLTTTVPDGMPVGSDVANLAVFGYDPRECYSGRAPLEAASMGITLGPGDVAYRMNLVSLIAGNASVFMHDFTAGHITTAESEAIIKTLTEELAEPGMEFYRGISYRNLFVWRKGEVDALTTPPHDISGKTIHEYLPSGPGAHTLVGLMTGSQILLKNHPVNIARREAGKNTADSIWLWGQGYAPAMESFEKRYGMTGEVVCAVDLIKGIGVAAGLKCPQVEGATGYLDTDYSAKARAGIEALKRSDFLYLHVEAPDEAAHAGLVEEKIKAIERFDELVVGPVARALADSGEPYGLLVMPDHPTPIRLKTHSRDPVPFIILESGKKSLAKGAAYDEKSAAATGLVVDRAWKLVPHLAGKAPLW